MTIDILLLCALLYLIGAFLWWLFAIKFKGYLTLLGYRPGLQKDFSCRKSIDRKHIKISLLWILTLIRIILALIIIRAIASWTKVKNILLT